MFSWTDVIAVLLSSFTGCFLWYFLWPVKRPPNFPRGPQPLGIFLGNLHNILLWSPKEFLPKLTELGNSYGKILGLSLGPKLSVVVNDATVLKELFSQTVFSGRPKYQGWHMFEGDRGQGLTMNSGPEWQELRRFTLTQMRNLGMNSKQKLEPLILNQVENALSLLEEYTDETQRREFSNHCFFNIIVFNSTWEIISGQKFDPNDPSAIRLIHDMEQASRNQFQIGIFALFPKLTKYFPFNRMQYSQMLDLFLETFTMYYEQAKMRHETSSYEPENLINVFLDNIKKNTSDTENQNLEKNEDQVNSVFHGEVGRRNLLELLKDLFIAGTETTGQSLAWTLFFLALHPEKQRKLHREIDQVLQGQLPTLDDQQRMPYLCAVIQETLRKSSNAALGIPHNTVEDTKYGEYLLPKGTLIFPNLYGIHHCKKTWGDPENFRPERFLSSGEKTLVKSESLLPFSIGKRICPGESLARTQLFLFIVRMFQTFSFDFVYTLQHLQPDGSKKVNMDAELGMALAPPSHKLIVKKRQI